MPGRSGGAPIGNPHSATAIALPSQHDLRETSPNADPDGTWRQRPLARELPAHHTASARACRPRAFFSARWAAWRVTPTWAVLSEWPAREQHSAVRVRLVANGRMEAPVMFVPRWDVAITLFRPPRTSDLHLMPPCYSLRRCLRGPGRLEGRARRPRYARDGVSAPRIVGSCRLSRTRPSTGWSRSVVAASSG